LNYFTFATCFNFELTDEYTVTLIALYFVSQPSAARQRGLRGEDFLIFLRENQKIFTPKSPLARRRSHRAKHGKTFVTL